MHKHKWSKFEAHTQIKHCYSCGLNETLMHHLQICYRYIGKEEEWVKQTKMAYYQDKDGI